MFNTDGFFVAKLGRLTIEHVKSILRISSISACNFLSEFASSVFPDSSWLGLWAQALVLRLCA